jgi:hypothetical protein
MKRSTKRWSYNFIFCLCLNQYSVSAQTNFPFYFCVSSLVPKLSPPCIVSFLQQKVIKHLLCFVLQGMQTWVKCYFCPEGALSLGWEANMQTRNLTLCGMWHTRRIYKIQSCFQTPKSTLELIMRVFIASFSLLATVFSHFQRVTFLSFIQRAA